MPDADVAPATQQIEQLSFEPAFKRWTIRCLQPGDSLTVEASLSHTVKIVDCNGGSVIVTGKCKLAFLDSSTDLTLTLHGVITTAEIVNCKRCTIVLSRVAPTVAVDKSEAVTIRLATEEAHGSAVVSSSDCSALAVELCSPNGDLARKGISRASGAGQVVSIVKQGPTGHDIHTTPYQVWRNVNVVALGGAF